MVFMLVGIACFELIPAQLLGLFTSEPEVFAIGTHAFHIIGLSFLPAVLSLIFPVFFQAIGAALPSILLSLTRQIFCLIPVFWFFSRIDLSYAWFAFPIAEVITGTLGLIFYARRVHIWGRLEQAAQTARRKGAVVMKMITAIINKRDSGEVCAALTEAGYYFTRMSSTGGFLTGGNTTLLIGTPEERGAPGHLHHPGALLPPDGEDLLQCAAGHAVRPLPHRGHSGRGHPVRIRRDPV